MSEERGVQEVHEPVPRGCRSRGQRRQHVSAQHRLAAQLGVDLLRFAQEVVVQQEAVLVLVLGQQDGLAVWIEPWTAGAAAHLLDLHHRDGRLPSSLEPRHVADDDPAGREIDAGCQRRGGDDALDLALLEVRFDEPALFVRQAGVVERHALLHARLQRLADGGLLSLIVRQIVDAFQHRFAHDLAGQLRELGGHSFGGPPGVDEHQALASLGDGIGHQAPQHVLSDRHLPTGVVGEHDLPVDEDPLLERRRPPFRCDQLGVQPVRDLPGVLDRR